MTLNDFRGLVLHIQLTVAYCIQALISSWDCALHCTSYVCCSGDIRVFLGQFWAILGPSKAIRRPSEGHVLHLFAMFGLSGVIFGSARAFLEYFWANLGPVWTLLGPSWNHLGLPWGHLGTILASQEAKMLIFHSVFFRFWGFCLGFGQLHLAIILEVSLGPRGQNADFP